MTEAITVCNAGDEPETTAEILIQNQLAYQPKVSVIIPVYNVKKYLRQCLDSVLNQTLKEIEIICVDDGSTDNSLQILQEYAAKDKRITVLAQKNLYAGIARNAGLTVAKGEYVHFLDSDDWIDVNTYENLYQLIVEKKAEIVKFRSYLYDNVEGKVTSDGYTDISGVPKAYFEGFLNAADNYKVIFNLPDSPWSGIYSLSFLRKNHILFDGLRCGNNVTFFYRCVLKAPVYLSGQRYVYYRVNNKSSLIGIRAYCFDDLIKQRKNILATSFGESETLRKFINQRTASSLIRWYAGYLRDKSLEDEVKKKIVIAMKEYVGEILKDDVMRKYCQYYNDLKLLDTASIIEKFKIKATKYYLFGIPLLKIIEA